MSFSETKTQCRVPGTLLIKNSDFPEQKLRNVIWIRLFAIMFICNFHYHNPTLTVLQTNWGPQWGMQPEIHEHHGRHESVMQTCIQLIGLLWLKTLQYKTIIESLLLIYFIISFILIRKLYLAKLIKWYLEGIK